jgi:hypothetical protein
LTVNEFKLGDCHDSEIKYVESYCCT